MSSPVPVRVFYFDDNEEQLHDYARYLSLRGFQVEAFLVERSAASREALRYRLRYGWWHAVIVDVSISSAGEDHLGIEMTHETDAVIPQFLFTAYPDQKWDVLKEALGKTTVTLIHKDQRGEKSGVAQLREEIEAALDSPRSAYRLNRNLTIGDGEWLPRLRLRRLRAEYQSEAEAVSELEDLMRKLFFDYHAIDFNRTTDLPDGTVLAVVVGQTNKELPTTRVVQFGRRETMRLIEERHTPYFEHIAGAAHRLEARETRHFGAVLYQLEGDPLAYRSLDDGFRLLEAEAIEALVERLFGQVLRPLYAARFPLPGDEPFDRRYRRALGLEGNNMAQRFRVAHNDLLNAHPLVRRRRDGDTFILADDLLPGSAPETGNMPLSDVERVVFTDEALFRLEAPTVETIVYGGLDAASLFSDPDGHVCLPGSARTDRGYFLRDVIALEAAIMLQAIVDLQSGGVIHPALLHALQLWLEPNDVTERIHADALDGSPYAKALAAAAVLRRCAARLGPEVDMRHYYGGLLFEAARLVMAARERSGREAPPHYVHAALGAALLAAVLESWPGRPWRPTEDAPDGDRLVLDRVNKRLYVPDCGRWLPLPEKLFRLLSLLDEKACRLVTYEEIDERVFDGRAGAGAIHNLVGQVRRLLREAGCDDRRYIHGERGLGYVLQPTGVPCSD